MLLDDNGDGVSDAGERTDVRQPVPAGNHGLAITPTHVYASSPTTVYRWAYASGDRTATGAMETVVDGIPAGGHATRTLVIDAQNRLYVSIGSAGNVDAPAGPEHAAATCARVIRRFDLDADSRGRLPGEPRASCSPPACATRSASPSTARAACGASRTAATT